MRITLKIISRSIVINKSYSIQTDDQRHAFFQFISSKMVFEILCIKLNINVRKKYNLVQLSFANFQGMLSTNTVITYYYTDEDASL